MAEKLGITQQSYAYFEANPGTATLDRLFLVLRIMGVEIILGQAIPVKSMGRDSSALGKSVPADKTPSLRVRKKVSAETVKEKKSSTVLKPGRVISSTQKKESW
jgi:HTH-type transcriptional regulator/antitoxin HipB